MTRELPVKEHLRNSALYQAESGPLPGEEWKRRLLSRNSMQRNFRAALQERKHLSRWFVLIGMPVLCVTFGLAVYFGFLRPEHWFVGIGPLLRFNAPAVGLWEVVLFIAVVNGLTFSIRKRLFTL